MLAWKIAPALAAGNSVIVKPAEQTSLTALRIAELSIEAGIPRGVFNVVTGMGPDVGQPLGLHPDVDMVSFTGSTETGRRFLRYSADSNLKKIVLECGGKNPAIVLDDAEELDLVAEHLINASFWNMGENCSANSRLIVQENIKEALLDKMLAHLRDWKTGDPLDPSNYLGEEVFGPILSVITVKSFDEAIAVANNTDYGLAASVFTANGKKAIRAARSIKAGTVTVNCYGEGDMSTPFGGYKQSGFGGRDNSIHAHDQYTELKTIWIDLSDRAPEESVD